MKKSAAFHLYIDGSTESISAFRAQTMNRDDLRIIEVAVEHNGVVKEFTYEEFLSLLGFAEEGGDHAE